MGRGQTPDEGKRRCRQRLDEGKRKEEGEEKEKGGRKEEGRRRRRKEEGGEDRPVCPPTLT